MKKLFALLLTLSLLMTLVACGAADKSASAPAPETSAPAETEPTAEPAPEAFELDGPVTFIIPYGTGGSTDIAGRLVAQYLSEIVGQQVNVVNKPGAAGVVGITELAQAKPDGHTIAVAGVSDLYAADYRGLFDINSVDYITWYLSVPFALYAAPDTPWNNIGELVEDIKAGTAGNICMAESGIAAIVELAVMCDTAGIDMIDTVSFASGGESMSALLGNHVELASLAPTNYSNVVAGGGKLLGIYGTEKIDLFEGMNFACEYGLEVPTVMATNQMITLPKDSPAEVVEFWENAMQELLANEEFQAAMASNNFVTTNVSGAELDAIVEEYNQTVGEIMEKLGLE